MNVATSKMEQFVIIVSALIIVTKSSILDVAAVLDPHLRAIDLEDFVQE